MYINIITTGTSLRVTTCPTPCVTTSPNSCFGNVFTHSGCGECIRTRKHMHEKVIPKYSSVQKLLMKYLHTRVLGRQSVIAEYFSLGVIIH